MIAAASGQLGTNAQYLFSLEQELNKLGMRDPSLDELISAVRALQAPQPDPNWQPGFA